MSGQVVRRDWRVNLNTLNGNIAAEKNRDDTAQTLDQRDGPDQALIRALECFSVDISVILE